MMKLRINPLVVSDLKDIRNYIAEDNAEKATETIEKIYGKFENIQLFPGMGAHQSSSRGFFFALFDICDFPIIIYQMGKSFVFLSIRNRCCPDNFSVFAQGGYC